VAGSCRHGIVTSISVIGSGFLDHLRDSWQFRKNLTDFSLSEVFSSRRFPSTPIGVNFSELRYSNLVQKHIVFSTVNACL